MTIAQLTRRVERIEQERPAARQLLCVCQMPGGAHKADCEALTASEADELVIIEIVRRTDLTSVKELTDVKPQRATDQASAIVGTNRQYVSDAKRIAQTAPDLIDKVRSGKATIPQVKVDDPTA